MSNNIQELLKVITMHDDLYWNLQTPKISDPEYDKLIQQLYKLDPKNEYFNIIKGPIINNKVKHIIPMLSLAKIYTFDDLEKWITKVSRSENEMFHISPKYDGIAAKQYSEKLLTTRGNGIIGENISNKIQQINYILPPKYPIIGELLLSYKKFQIIRNKYFKKDGCKYKTIRNFTAGFFNSDKIDKSIIFDFVSYDYYYYNITSINFINTFKAIIEQLTNFHYPIDGIVIKLNDINYFNSLGATSHHPRGAIAFKFNNPTAKSKLIDVEWQTGTQSITPIGIIDPTTINNVTISKVTLHNMKFIIEKNIYINDILDIERSGDVIPHVINSTPSDKNRIQIQCLNCPICGYMTIYKEPKLICSNINCDGMLSRRLTESVKRLGIENLGLPTIINIIEMFNITVLSQLFDLSITDFKQLPRFADKSATNLFTEIQKIKSKLIEDWRILGSLMISGISNSSAKKIMEYISLDELQKASIKKLMAIESIGNIKANIIYNELYNKRTELERLKQVLTIQITKKNKKNIIKKQKICFTGKNDNYTKTKLHQLATNFGFECVKSVTRDLNILVIPNINNYASTKVKKAKKYQIQIITLNEFLKFKMENL